MTTGAQTPIAVFSLGLGPLIGAGISGVSAAVPAVTAGVEAATAAAPAVTAAIPAAVGAAEAIGTTGPMIADVIAGAAPPLIEGGTALAQGVSTAIPEVVGLAEQLGTTPGMIADLMPQAGGLVESVSGGVAEGVAQAGPSLGNVGPWQAWNPGNMASSVRPPLLPSGMTSVAQTASPPVAADLSAPTLTAEQAMANITGPQMSQVPVEASLEAGWGPAANMSTEAGPVFMPRGGAMPSGASSAETPWYRGERGNKFMKSVGKQLAKRAIPEQKSSGGGQASPALQPQPPPPSDPYRSPYASQQLSYSERIMQEYLSGGGYG